MALLVAVGMYAACRGLSVCRPNTSMSVEGVITVSEDGNTLGQVLGRLREKKLNVRAPKLVQDDRVIVRATQQTEQIIRNLAHLLNCRIDSTQASPADGQYELVFDLKARRQEEELSDILLARASAPLLLLTTYTSTPPALYEQKYKELRQAGKEVEDPLLADGNLRQLTRRDVHAALNLLASLRPDQRRTLFSTQRYTLAWGQMTPRQQELASAIEEQVERVRARGLTFEVTTDLVSQRITFYRIDLGGFGPFVVVPTKAFSITPMSVRGRPYDPPKSSIQTIRTPLDDLRLPEQLASTNISNRSWTGVLGELSSRTAIPVYSDDFVATPEFELPEASGIPYFSLEMDEERNTPFYNAECRQLFAAMLTEAGLTRLSPDYEELSGLYFCPAEEAWDLLVREPVAGGLRYSLPRFLDWLTQQG